MKRVRRGTVAVASALWLMGVTPAGSSAQTLPDQASPVAEEHTHGPDGLDLDRRGRPVQGASYAVDIPATWMASEYDGAAPTSDQPDGTRAGLPMFHAVYVYPSDKPSRFGTYAAMFQADARDASKLLELQYGRAIRFDQRGEMLDITVLRSKHNSKQLAGSRQFNLVNDELVAAGFTVATKKYVVWLDAGSRYCGQGHLSQDRTRASTNLNERRNLAVVYRPYDPNDASTGGFCRGRTLRHELGHTLGALQSTAPNAFDGAHCDDSGEDTMCYTSATSADTGGPAFDYGNDDYWDPRANPTYGSQYPASAPEGKLQWWAVNLSAFLCDSPTECQNVTTRREF